MKMYLSVTLLFLRISVSGPYVSTLPYTPFTVVALSLLGLSVENESGQNFQLRVAELMASKEVAIVWQH